MLSGWPETLWQQRWRWRWWKRQLRVLYGLQKNQYRMECGALNDMAEERKKNIRYINKRRGEIWIQWQHPATSDRININSTEKQLYFIHWAPKRTRTSHTRKYNYWYWCHAHRHAPTKIVSLRNWNWMRARNFFRLYYHISNEIQIIVMRSFKRALTASHQYVKGCTNE